MAQWGRNDQAVTANSSTTKETSNGAPIGTYALINGGSTSNIASISASHATNGHFGNTSSGSRANIDAAMYGNSTISAFRQDVAVGVYGLDSTEMSFTDGSTNGVYRVVSGGTGYSANAVVTLTFANGYSNVSAANSTIDALGRVTTITSNVTIANIKTKPTLTIAAPSAINIVANTNGVSATNDFIAFASANSKFQVGDHVYYGVPTNNTAIAGLTGNSNYWIAFSNSSGVVLSATKGGANVDITEARTTNPGETHTFTGDTATGVLIPSGAKFGGVPHAGWVLRTEGTGGRAGRVQYEVLVAMGSLGAQTAAYGTPANVADGADDNIFHDS